MGSDTARWKDGYFGADTIHLGTAIGDEGTFTYNTSTGKWDEPSGKPEGYSYWDEDANTWQTA